MKVLSVEEIEVPAGGLAFIPLLAAVAVGGYAGGYAYGWAVSTF